MLSSCPCYTTCLLTALSVMAVSASTIEASDRLIESIQEEDVTAVSMMSDIEKATQDIENSMQEERRQIQREEDYMQEHRRKMHLEEAELERLAKQKQKVAKQKQIVAQIAQKRLVKQKQTVTQRNFASEMLKDMKVIKALFENLSGNIFGQEDAMDKLNKQLAEIRNMQNALVNQTLMTTSELSEQQDQTQLTQRMAEEQANLAASIGASIFAGHKEADYHQLQERIRQMEQEVRENVDLTQSVIQILKQESEDLLVERAHTETPSREHVLRR